jgi:hypothetical protein
MRTVRGVQEVEWEAYALAEAWNGRVGKGYGLIFE